MAFSLDDGALVGTFGGTEGEGPGELQHMSAAIAAARLFSASQMACVGDVAYVLDEHLTGYSLDGRTFAVPIPAELAERSQQIREAVRNSRGGGFRHPYSGLFDDGNGNLVITLWPSDVAGAVIVPETGCHSILLDTEPQRMSRRLAGMYRDSVVVFGNQTDVQMIDGKRTTVTYAGEAFMIALRPLQPAGGEPCPAP